MHLRVKTASLIIALSIIITGSAHAGLLNTDGAEPVETKHIEVEFNGAYMADDSNSGAVKVRSTDGDITITAGVAKEMDIAFTLPYSFGARRTVNGDLISRTEGFNDMTVDLKFQFLDLDGLKLAIKPGVILPTGKSSEGLSDRKFGYAAFLITTKELYEGKFALHANAGYGRHNFKDDAVRDANRPDIFSFSIACEAEAAEGLKLAADMRIATNADKTSDTPHAFAIFGAKYELSKTVEGYAGIKTGLTTTEADVAALLGIVLKF